jgi:tRNA A-37 threonylcarbamoyl transferase component Bud32
MRILADRYELVERAGRGGMGEVWRATDRELGRTVAVKMLPPELTRHEEFRIRFRREARTVASLSHRNIAVLHDVGEDVQDGETTPFLIMEFIDGRTLADALAEGPFMVERALEVGQGVAEALAYSHDHGLIHRDIKPSNIMFTSEGGIKVLDFGIAKVVAETSTRLTATGMAVGTPAYLSPEQLTGREVDGRSDQYSTGCLLYELLTGRPPFIGDSPFAVMHQHISENPVAPSKLRSQVPAAVDAVLLRALSKDREQRFADAGELRQALALAGTRTPPVPGRPPGSGPGGTMLAAEPTQAAPVPKRVSPAVPAPPVAPVEAAPGQSGGPPADPPLVGAAGTDHADSAGVGSGRKRRFLPAGNRIVALLGILVSGVVALGYDDMYPQDSFLGPFVVSVVLGLVAFRWLPLTSALLWWGAGALVIAGVVAGAAVDEEDYTSVSESDFSSTLYYYDSNYEGYYQLEMDPDGYLLLEEGYDGEYTAASGESTTYYTGHETISILAVPVLTLGVLCLAGALRPRRHSILLAASGVILFGLGVSWLGFGTGDQIAMFSLVWGLATLVALVQELRGRTGTPSKRPRRRLRFVVAE